MPGKNTPSTSHEILRTSTKKLNGIFPLRETSTGPEYYIHGDFRFWMPIMIHGKEAIKANITKVYKIENADYIEVYLPQDPLPYFITIKNGYLPSSTHILKDTEGNRVVLIAGDGSFNTLLSSGELRQNNYTKEKVTPGDIIPRVVGNIVGILEMSENELHDKADIPVGYLQEKTSYIFHWNYIKVELLSTGFRVIKDRHNEEKGPLINKLNGRKIEKMGRKLYEIADKQYLKVKVENDPKWYLVTLGDVEKDIPKIEFLKSEKGRVIYSVEEDNVYIQIDRYIKLYTVHRDHPQEIRDNLGKCLETLIIKCYSGDKEAKQYLEEKREVISRLLKHFSTEDNNELRSANKLWEIHLSNGDALPKAHRSA